MSVQDHIENILNAQGKDCTLTKAWSAAICEHPQAADENLTMLLVIIL